MSQTFESVDLPIPGLKLIELGRHFDERGWFSDWWQFEKYSKLGLGNFSPVQSNLSSNLEIGVTRGMHAEPWNKLVTVAHGKAFAAWVDLRPGGGFGKVHSLIIEPGQAIYVPRGVANGYQTLEPETVYLYLVDGLWDSMTEYVGVNAFDTSLDIPWPVSQQESLTSIKDDALDSMENVNPYPEKQIIILGSSGQVGKEMSKLFPDAVIISRDQIESALNADDFEPLVPKKSVLINCAAWTDVESGEKVENTEIMFKINAILPAKLAEACESADSTLVQFSSDYVFDGSKSMPYCESDPPNPLNRYGSSKLSGDYSVLQSSRHYIIRTSWVFGSGKNFIDTVRSQLLRGTEMRVADDQFGRPTSARDLARFTRTLLEIEPPCGIYNFTSSGEATSWFQLARFIANSMELSVDLLKPVSTKSSIETGQYLADRPRNSLLDCKKINELGIWPREWQTAVLEHLHS